MKCVIEIKIKNNIELEGVSKPLTGIVYQHVQHVPVD